MARLKAVELSPTKQIAVLTQQLESAQIYHRDACAARDKANETAEARNKIIADLRKNIDDLKVKLQKAEAENQRMRGYIERVQEDDIVREDLISVGDPDGQSQLVPKRKQTSFHEPAFTRQEASNPYYQESAPPNFWITY